MTMINLFDGLGKGWDLYGGGYVSDGTNDAFDDAYGVDVYNGALVGLEQGGREAVFAAQAVNADVSIARKVYVSDVLGFARFLTSVTNTSGHAVDYTLQVIGNLGSDSGTYVVDSSDHNAQGSTRSGVTFGANATWVITDDTPTGVSGEEDPINLSLYGNANGGATLSRDDFTYTYNLHLAAGETQTVMNVAVMTETLGAAQAMAVKLSAGEQIYTGMSAVERAGLVNWSGVPVVPPSTHPGEAVLDLAGAYDSGHSAVLQADGKLLVLTGGGDAAQPSLIRVNTDGTRDAAFDVAANAKGGSFALQSDGKILVAGTDSSGFADDGRTVLSVMRLNADGTLDAGFGAGGKLTVDVNGNDFSRDIRVQTDGKILLVGDYAGGGWNGSDYASLVRLNADGTLDSGFGDGGVLTSQSLDRSSFHFGAITELPGGKILVVGDTNMTPDSDMVAFRLNADGSADAGFGDGGMVALDFGSRYDFAQSVMVQVDGKILIAGGGFDDNGVPLLKLARLAADGSPDASFGVAGKMVVNIGGSLDDGFSLNVLDGGKILISGNTYDSANGHTFTRVQLNADGALDGSFGSAGVEHTALNGETVVIAGSGTNASALHLNADHTLAIPGPTSGPSTVNSVEDTGKVLTLKDFVFHAVTPGTTLRAVKIDTPTDSGHFQLNKLDLAGDQSVSVTDINAGKLVFVPAANVNGAVHFDYQVSDGTLWSHSAGTLNFNIAPVRDDLVLTGTANGDTLTGDAIDAGSYDTLSGLGGNDNLLGLAGNDTLDGGAGNDFLDGGTGADKMTGGDGNDTYVVDNAGDIVIETNGKAAVGGVDLVMSHLAAYTLTANVENGSIDVGGPANLTGNSLDNLLYAGDGVNDIDGSAGNDTVSFAHTDSLLGVTLDLSLVKGGWSIASGGSGADRVKGIENIVGSGGDDTLTGTNAANVLDGGHGADRLTGGDGSDIYYVDNIGDIVVETNANARNGGVDTVYSWLNDYQLTANVENGVILGEGGTLTGNGLDNVLTGGAGNDVLVGGVGNDTLAGGDGRDTLIGGAGKDTMTGGAGADTFVFTALADMDVISWKMDVITDFVHGTDKIDLTGIDANPSLSGVQAFTFIGSAAFKGDSTGQLRFDPASHILYGSTNADFLPEFGIVLTGVKVFSAGDLASLTD